MSDACSQRLIERATPRYTRAPGAPLVALAPGLAFGARVGPGTLRRFGCHTPCGERHALHFLLKGRGRGLGPRAGADLATEDARRHAWSRKLPGSRGERRGTHGPKMQMLQAQLGRNASSGNARCHFSEIPSCARLLDLTCFPEMQTLRIRRIARAQECSSKIYLSAPCRRYRFSPGAMPGSPNASVFDSLPPRRRALSPRHRRPSLHRCSLVESAALQMREITALASEVFGEVCCPIAVTLGFWASWRCGRMFVVQQ